MKEKMPPFKRKKSTGKSFPVKVCTLDAELEFNLEVPIPKNYITEMVYKLQNISLNVYKYLFS